MPRLNSYRPLCGTRFGCSVAQQNGLKPYIDGSIRREPDFENPFPSITGLCRLNKFAPALRVGSTVAYITVKGLYGEHQAHWRLVAILDVIEQFTLEDAHRQAFDWYKERGLQVPRNCVANGNMGADFNLSTQQMDIPKSKRRGADEWEAEYQNRALVAPAFNITRVRKLALENPPILLTADMRRIFLRVPGTQTPPYITEDQLGHLEIEFERQR